MTVSDSGKPRPRGSWEPKNSPALEPLGASSALTAFCILSEKWCQGLVNRSQARTAELQDGSEAGTVQETRIISPAATAILLVNSRLLSGERKMRRSRHDFLFCRKCSLPKRSNAMSAKNAINQIRPGRM